MFITLFFSLPSIWNSNFRSIWVMRPFWNLAHRLYPVPDKLTNRFIDSSSSPRPWAMDHLCLPNECLLLSVIYFPSVLFIWIQLNVFPTVRGILIVICCAIHRMRLPACAVTVSAEMVVDYTRLLCLFRHRLLRHKLVLSFKLWSELAHTHTSPKFLSLVILHCNLLVFIFDFSTHPLRPPHSLLFAWSNQSDTARLTSILPVLSCLVPPLPSAPPTACQCPSGLFWGQRTRYMLWI